MTNTNKMITALAAGVAIGSLLGILFAPDKGENTRKKIVDNGKKLTDSLKGSMKEGKNRLAGLKNGMLDKVDSIRDSVEEFAS
jgi:gas vesicle protein